MQSGCVGRKYKNHIASQNLAPAAFSRGTTQLLTVESQGCVLRCIRTTLNSPRRPPKTASLAALLSSCSGHASLPQKLSQGGKTKSIGEQEKKKKCTKAEIHKLHYSPTGFSGLMPCHEADYISKQLQNQILTALWIYHLDGIKV